MIPIQKERDKYGAFVTVCCVHACSVAQSSLTTVTHQGCSPPGSSVWDFPDKILEWVAMPSSRGSSRPRDQTSVSCPRIGRQFLPTWEAPTLCDTLLHFFFFFFFTRDTFCFELKRLGFSAYNVLSGDWNNFPQTSLWLVLPWWLHW